MTDHPADDVGITDDDAQFEVVGECPVGEVRAAEQRNALVGRDQLGVQSGLP